MAAVAAATTASLGAQSVRGIIVDAAGAPVAGALATLVDSTAPVAVRALSNDRGEFILRAPHAGVFRVRVNRIGFQPKLSEALTVQDGQTASLRLTVDNLRLRLDTVRVASRSDCRVLDGNSATFALWQQARTAIASTMTTVTGQTLRTSAFVYERGLDRTGNRVVWQQLTLSSGVAGQPWVSNPPEVLSRYGYVLETDDSTAYSAPGLEVLASDAFASGHCFRVVSGTDTSQIGLEFEPAKSRGGVVDIRGTLWLTRATAELNRVEFGYTNLDRSRARYAGGSIELVHLPNQAWAVSRWAIRMPVLRSRRSPVGLYDQEWLLEGFKVRGGELSSVTVAAAGRAQPGVSDTIWHRAPYVFRGWVSDSVTGTPAAHAQLSIVGTDRRATTNDNGEFVLADLLPGEYDVQVRTSLLERVGAVSQSRVALTDTAARVNIRLVSPAQIAATLCRVTPLGRGGRGAGVVVGSVFGAMDSVPGTPPRVVVEWQDLAMRPGSSGVATERRVHTMEAPADSAGDFRVCGVPVNTPLTLRAMTRQARSAPVSLVIPDEQVVARSDLLLEALGTQTANIAGVVTADSSGLPLAGAEVMIPSLGLATRTNAKGAFRLEKVPPGIHPVVARVVGFAPLDTMLDMASASSTDEHRFVLHRLTVLDSVVTEANVRLTSFDEHRRMGLGRFATREDLEKLRGSPLTAIVGSFGGASLTRGRGGAAWLTSGRGVKSLAGTITTVPGEFERSRGAPPACYAHVWVDGVQVYAARDREPLFDLNSLTLSQIEAIEYYAGPSQTPAEYAGNKSACGVLVIWTRK